MPSVRSAIAAIISIAPTGYLPTALSWDSITASVPSRIALATSATSARVGRDEDTIESSIWVAVIDGRASAPASAITCFCTIGTSSMRISMPRSPRATITQSAARTISSARWTACGFSILAISGSRVWPRTNSTSSARRTNDSATRSTPIFSPTARCSRSSSGTAGSEAASPGMLRPWREATGPPISTIVSISPCSGRVAATRRRTVPSARYMTSSGPTASASPSQEMYMRCLSPRAVVVAAAHEGQRARPGRARRRRRASLPMRSFGPGRSCSTATWRPGAVGGVADALDHLGVLLGAAVREVQPRDVHPGLDHAHEDLGLTGGRSDGRDDLRPAHRPRIYHARRRRGAAQPRRSVARRVTLRRAPAASRPANSIRTRSLR